MRRCLEFYLASARIAILSQIQYRVANYFYMIGMIAEPVIYLVVWSTIARQQGGQVGGFTPGEFAAYYIVWTLVRQMNIIFTPYGWEERIRQGELSAMLLHPIFQLMFTAELLLSGRLVPLSLMPDWAQRLADLLPFKWTFGYPIEALIGHLPDAELFGGLAMQLLWIVIGAIGVRIVWRFAIRRYSAVSG